MKVYIDMIEKIFNSKIVYLVLIFLCSILFSISFFSLFSSMDKKEQNLEDYMTRTYDEWFVSTAVGITGSEPDISYFKGYFISEPDIEIQVDYLNGKRFSKYYWSSEESNPVYGDYLSGIINRYFDVSDYTIHMNRGNKYQHFLDNMDMDEIIDYLKDNDLDIYFTGNVYIEPQDSTVYAFEVLSRILFDDLKDEGYHFDFNIIGILENGTPVNAHFHNLKWNSLNSGVIFSYDSNIEINEELSSVEASLDDLGDESELNIDYESKFRILDEPKKNTKDKNEIGPAFDIDISNLSGDRKGE